MTTKIAYIDESGNHDLDTSKSGSSGYFIVAAVIIDAPKEEEFLQSAEILRIKHFQVAEIKSSNVRARNQHRRRIEILNDIMSLDFKFYALAIDKAAIFKTSGLQYKRSFIKNLNGKLYGSLFQHYADIKVLADETGDIEFSKSLKTYVDDNHIPDLFIESSFELLPSHSCVGIQIADFIAGTLAQVYEGKANHSLTSAYLNLIRERSVGLDEWPIKYSPRVSKNTGSNSQKYDETIKEYAANQAHIFLEKNRGNHDAEAKMQLCILEYLLFESHWNDARDYVPTHSLMSHLRESGYRKISEQLLRSNIIAKLRDSGVIISSSNKGYKIPRALSDLHDFANRIDAQVIPQLKRLNKARKNILLTTSNELDILNFPNFEDLSVLISAIEK
jgi:hypothetical protein